MRSNSFTTAFMRLYPASSDFVFLISSAVACGKSSNCIASITRTPVFLLSF
jgi:hypothetical protein